MRRNCLLIFLLIVLMFLSSISARLLPTKQGEKEIIGTHGISETVEETSLPDINQDFSTLMGSEECDEKDEDCLKRRMIAEAHLDYIYTQHHKKP